MVAWLIPSDRAAYWFVHDGNNNFLNRLPSITVHAAKRLKREYQDDAELMSLLNSHIETLAKTENSTIRDVFEKANNVIGYAMMANAGGTFVYIVPLGLMFFFAGSIKSLVTKLIVTPAKQVERLIPRNPLTP